MDKPEKHCTSQDLTTYTAAQCCGGTIDAQYKTHARDYSAPLYRPTSNAVNEESGANGTGVGHHDGGKLSPEDARRKVNELRLRSSTIEQLGRDETELRIKMYFHISDPLNRWKKYRYVTWKFLLQLTKTFCIAAQIALFVGSPAGKKSSFASQTHSVFSKLLISQSMPTPQGIVRPSEVYNTYSTQGTLDALEFAGNNFYTRPFPAIGYDPVLSSNGSVVPIQVVAVLYAKAELNTTENTYTLNATLVQNTFNLLPPKGGQTITQQFLDLCGYTCFDRLLSMDIRFGANYIRVISPALGLVQCYLVNVKLSFVAMGNGMGTYSLSTKSDCVMCRNITVQNRSKEDLKAAVGLNVLLDVIMFLVSSASFTLTLATLQRAYVLAMAMKQFYHNHLHIQLSWRDRTSLYPYWHLVTILSDLCTFTATALNFALDLNFDCKYALPYDGDLVRIILGISIVLHATVILRYVSYFRQFNVLSRALDRAIPQLLKYIVFVTILFLGFMVCGWVVLSPFHLKFTTLTKSFNALFTMLNGDDLYNTFTGFGIDLSDNALIYLFGQAFFVIFMTLFIYTILNLFISLIVEAHEESQAVDDTQLNEVAKFIYSDHLTEGAMSLRDLGLSRKYVDPDVIMNRPTCRPGSPSDKNATL